MSSYQVCGFFLISSASCCGTALCLFLDGERLPCGNGNAVSWLVMTHLWFAYCLLGNLMCFAVSKRFLFNLVKYAQTDLLCGF